MARWLKGDLHKIAEADDLHIAPFREDGVTYGTPTWARVSSRVRLPSRRPIEKAYPMLVVARASKPRYDKRRAEPTSQGFGRMNAPSRSWSSRKARPFSSRVRMAPRSSSCRYVVCPVLGSPRVSPSAAEASNGAFPSRTPRRRGGATGARPRPRGAGSRP